MYKNNTLEPAAVRYLNSTIQRYHIINYLIEKNKFINYLEIGVFKGAFETLKNIDYIISEVNCDEVYEGCPHVNELDEYLHNFGFKRIKTDWAGVIWGDALYVK